MTRPSPFAGAAVSVFLLDRATKALVATRMVPNQTIPVLPPVFHITYVLNPGAAFGLFPMFSWLYLIVGIAVVLAIGVLMIIRPPAEPLFQKALGLILGGTFSNVLDRAWAGRVIDYLDFRVWPVFNFADTAINIGVALLLWMWWRQSSPEKR